MSSDAVHWNPPQSSFANEGLKTRLRSRGNVKTAYNTENDEESESSATKSKDVQLRFVCDICEKSFSSKGLLRRHENTHKTSGSNEIQQKCPHCRKIFQTQEYHNHLPLCKKRQISCSLCPMKFETSRSLGIHMTKVHRGNPSRAGPGVKCPQCGIKEPSDVSLARHTLIHHNPVACDFCGITFPSLTEAQQHKDLLHKLKSSKLKCEHCSMQFRWIMSYERHIANCRNAKVPCEFCGKSFKSEAAVNKHVRNRCRAYGRSERQEPQQEQKNAEKISPILVDCGLAQPACYCCDEIFSSAGHLNHHLKICHELTKCDICGITILGLSPVKNHKMKFHTEPKYECQTCGSKFHRKVQYEFHCSICERRKYTCTLCDRTYQKFSSIKWHTRQHHPDETSLNHIRTESDKDVKRTSNNDLAMEISTEKVTISTRDEQEESSGNPSSNKTSDSRSNGHSLATMNDDELIDNQEIGTKSPMVSTDPSNGSGEVEQVDSEETSQPIAEESSYHPYSCNMCDKTFSTGPKMIYHKLTRHKEAKFQCPNCSKKFHYKRKFEVHVPCCEQKKYPCKICGHMFKDCYSIKKHCKQVHPDGGSLEKNQAGEGKEQIQNDDLKMEITVEETKISARDDPSNSVENMELNLEIKVEETMLQEEQCQVSEEDDLGKSFATIEDSNYGQLMDHQAEEADVREDEIRVKEEYLED